MLKGMKIKSKLPILFLIMGVIPLIIMSTFAYNQIKKTYIKDAVGGLMNFVDAKQQGIIRFIDQNRKLAIQLSQLSSQIPPEQLSAHFKTIVETDVFDPEKHPFKDEIKSGKRKIPTFRVYHYIDYVKDGKIAASSDVSRIGKTWNERGETKWGYGDPYGEDGKLIFTFSKRAKEGIVNIHADGKMLTNIVNGEIGNLPDGIGAFYLAGVGKTMDYYIVNRENKMITESRGYTNAILNEKGSVEPWEKTINGHTEHGCNDGKYLTNAGVMTGCREAMGFYSGQKGQLILGASMPFYDSEWTITVEQEAGEILAPLYQIKNRIIVFLVVVILIIALGIPISRGISKPISLVMDSLKDIATGEGDLTKRIAIDSKDEIGELSRWFNTFVEKVHGIVVRISKTSQSVASASEQMSATSDNMSKTISSESERVTQMASSMEEMSATVTEVAKNASDVSEHAKQTMKIAESGGNIVQEGIKSTNRIAEKVGKLTGTVNALGSSSQKIGEIIGVIDDIADQTNLLALNAAIEAARAGEQGRGFAVVADEVRKLAERTTKATKEISEMIKTIQKDTQEAVNSMGEGRREVEAGVEVSKKIGESLQDIIKSVKTITDRINQIATASEEQAAASEEVTGNIDAISSGAKETSLKAKESANIAKELSRQAAGLQEIVGQFKL